MNIKDIVNFDLKKIDMKKIDLKSFDINAIQSFMVEKQTVVAQVVVVLASVFSLIALGIHFQGESQRLKGEINILKQKKNVISQYEKILTNEKEFKNALPKEIDEDQLSNQITDFAGQHNVTIASFSSEKNVSDKFKEEVLIHASISTSSYKDFLMFLDALESADLSFKVDAIKLLSSDNQGIAQLNSELDIIYTYLKK